MVQKSGGRLAAGDRAGRSGLQAQYDERLAGSAGIRVATSGGRTVFEQAATDGEDVETTLDPDVQDAAEQALADADLSVPGAIVAVDVRSGEVVASANSPTSGFDRALTGRYPPGSTFKVATSYAYLTRGITTPDATVPCPATATVDGREFRNYAGESISGSPTFFEDFTVSCNTAFVGLSGPRSPTTTSRRRPRPSASAPAGPTSSASAVPSRAACRAPRAAPTPRRRPSARAGSRSHPSRWR